ncbi:tyrosine-type recombinase/integrase [Priestia koreensis]|uniref:tyrosine-type recombinase/integrase n=1 Tax=Priestia koreensis TaxID=284581 RepID=UPI003D013EAC
MLLKFAVQEMYDDREFKNLSPVTLENYKEMLGQFEQYCRDNEVINVEDITANHVKKFLIQCQKKGNKPSSINSKLTRIKAFLNYMVEIEIIKDNPAKRIQRLKEDIRIEVFTDYHIKQMLNYYRRIKQREKAFYAYRDYTIIVVLISTGIRLGELCNLKWSDIDFQNYTMSVCGKMRKYESIPITEKLVKELASYKLYCAQVFKDKGLSDAVFTNNDNEPMTENAVKNMFKRLAQVMNFRDVRLSANTFRHSFCQRCIQSGMSTFAVQRLMRHSSLLVTQRYAAMWGKDLKEQNDKFNPLNTLEV